MRTTVNRVAFARVGSPDRIGSLRQCGDHTWVEDGLDRLAIYSFRELARTAHHIDLIDYDRNLSLRLDLAGRVVRAFSASEGWYDLYAIIDHSSSASGWLLNRVQFGDPADKIRGVLGQRSPSLWVMKDATQGIERSFVETARDEFTLELSESAGGTQVRVDLARGKLYLHAANGMASAHPIVSATCEPTGWLVDWVEFSAGGIRPTARLRQQDLENWIEENHADSSRNLFREVQRTESSIKLEDSSRAVTAEIDLKANLIHLTQHGRGVAPYQICASETVPNPGLGLASTVTSLVCGTDAGGRTGTFRMGAGLGWQEFDAKGRLLRDYRELGRDRWSIVLDAVDGQYRFRIDLFLGQIVFADPEQSTVGSMLTQVLSTDSAIDGLLANRARVGFGSEVDGEFLQIGPAAWARYSKQHAEAEAFFDEVSRDADKIMLFDPERRVHASIDFAQSQVVEWPDSQPALQTIRFIVGRTRAHDRFPEPGRISSRSVLAEEFDLIPGRKPAPRPVYRVCVKLPQSVLHADLRASAEASLEVNGLAATIDPVQAVRVRPNALSRVVITIAATSLQAPTLYLRTNEMAQGDRFVITPDKEVHRKLAAMSDDTLWNHRDALGVGPTVGRDDLASVQKTVRNLARAVQYSHNRTRHGVHHDRALHPANMEHAHFVLDFAGRAVRYTPLERAQVEAHIAGAQRVVPPAGQGFLDALGAIGNFIADATKIVIHTAEAQVETVIDTVVGEVRNVVDTAEKVGDDLVHGDVLDAGSDLLKGGENVATILAKGAAGMAKNAISGAGQLLVATMEVGEKLYQFVIQNTGELGKVVESLFAKVGVALSKVVNLFLDAIGWDKVLATHDVIHDYMLRCLEDVNRQVKGIKAGSDSFFADLARSVSGDFERAIGAIDPDGPALKVLGQPSPVDGFSAAAEKVEWLLSKLLSPGPTGSAIGNTPGGRSSAGSSKPSSLATLQRIVAEEFGEDGRMLKRDFADAVDRIQHFLSEPAHDPRHLMGALLEICKDIAVASLHLVAKVVDALLDFVASIIEDLKDSLQQPIDLPVVPELYAALTDGRPLTSISLAALLLAVPASLLSPPLDLRPLDPSRAGMSYRRADLQSAKDGLGGLAAVLHIVLAAVSGPVDAMTYSGARAEAQGLENPYKADPTKKQKLMTLGGVSVLTSLVQSVVGMPAPPGTKFQLPPSDLKDNVLRANEYWSTVCWGAGLIPSILTLPSFAFQIARFQGAESFEQIDGNVIPVLTALYGMVHCGLVGHLAVVEARKARLLEAVFDDPGNASLDGVDSEEADFQWAERLIEKAKDPDFGGDVRFEDGTSIYRPPREEYRHDVPAPPPNQDPHGAKNIVDDGDETPPVAEWVQSLRDYHLWASKGQNFSSSQGLNFSDKVFGNICDVLPDFAPFMASKWMVDATEGYSVIGTGVLDVFGHLAEGITIVVRVAKDASRF